MPAVNRINQRCEHFQPDQREEIRRRPLRWVTGQGKSQLKTAEGNAMIPLMSFIVTLITFYIWILVISAILSWLIAFDVVNRRNQVVYMIADTLQRMTEPALRPIRNVLPDFGALDISPLVLFFGLIFVRDVVIKGWICGGLCG